MRAEQIEPHLRCNQNCTFCTSRRPTDDPRFVVGGAVLARITAAVEKGAREIVLTGGEPTLRKDLASLIAAAKRLGVRVVLETNATTIERAHAFALRDAGLDLARVHLSGWGEALDRVTRDPGGFARALVGIDALLAAGIEVEASAVIVRSTTSLLAELPERLAARGIRLLRLVVPTRSPDETELLDYEAASETILALDDRARGCGLALKLAPDAGPPPCVFPDAGRVAHLYSLTPGATRRTDHEHAPACTGCLVRDRCSGLSIEHVARFGVPPMRPVTEERRRRRLALVSTVEAQIARELVSASHSREPGAHPSEEIVRVNFHCNQACDFCFVSTHLPPAGDAAVRRAIEEAAGRDARIILSGGEPTLNASLVEHVRLAKSLSRHLVTLQTNAVRLDDRARVAALREAGLDEAFVSLHGSRAEIADSVTRAPGTFARTLVGIDHLVEAGVVVTTNFVICEANLDDLVETTRLVGTRWKGVFFNVSFVAASTDVVPRDRSLVPRYADAIPRIAESLALAGELGLKVVGFDSMCGIPLCLVPASVGRFVDLDTIPPGFDGGEFLKTDTCARCSLEARCYGVRRGYAELHGTDELRAVE